MLSVIFCSRLLLDFPLAHFLRKENIQIKGTKITYPENNTVITMTKDVRPQTVSDSTFSAKRKRVTLLIARTAVMTALITAGTMLIQIYNPVTRGYLNFGDIMIFISALTFGPTVGGFSAGIGSALSDALSGYGYFAPFTFIIKGIEGAAAGLISNRHRVWRDVFAVSIAGAVMVFGYFIAEFFPLQLGWASIAEVPGNISQVVVGAIIGVPIALVIRKRLPEPWWK